MTIDDLLGDGPTYLPPPSFRYGHLAKDFPAKEALEEVLAHFVRGKQRQMAEVDFHDALYESACLDLDEMEDEPPEDAGRRYPKHAAWFTFDVRLEDLPGSPPVEKFSIELAESTSFSEPDEHTYTSVLEVYMLFGYDALSIMFRFIKEPKALFCECIVKYAEGDGDEVTALAEYLRSVD
jgi:hypothetical protein